jgi:transcriptional regulator with XRE-family HTH domain
MLIENLKKIQNDPNYYIDIEGNIYNSDLKVLKPFISSDGTLGIVLPKNIDGINKSQSKKIARLLLEHFVRKPKSNEIVFYIDDNKSNIDLSNLKWGKRQDLPVKRIYTKGNSNTKFDAETILKVKARLLEGVSQVAIAKEFNMSETHVSGIKHGTRGNISATQNISIKSLYTFSHDVYNATLHGVFVAARVDLKNAIGKTITINEDVIELSEYMFNELTVSALVIESLLEATNNKLSLSTICGYNPLEYIEEE